MELKKGFIKVLEGENKNKEIDILYFPPEYSIEKSNSFSEIAIPGLESPYLQFVKGNATSISLEIFYDTYEERIDVRTLTNKLTDLMNIDPTLHAPPPLEFIWGVGSKEIFYCVLESVTKKFTMFRSLEMDKPPVVPVRARLTVKLKEFKKELSERERRTQSPDKTKTYMVKQDDSLWYIAYREYGDPSKWRPIANKNKIDDPRFLIPGSELIIPPLE
jgi:hypothetical protein